MASTRVRTRKDGTAYTSVQFREGGKQRTLSFDDPHAAVRYAQLIDRVGPAQARAYLEATTDSELAVVSVAEWCRGYVDRLTGVEEGTRRRYRSILERDIEPVLGPLPLASLDDSAISSWVQSLDGAGKTIKNKHGFLSGALAAAVKAGHLKSNPCEGRRLPRSAREEMTFLSPGEFATLLHFVPPYWRALVTVLVSTGMRWSEATALQVRDVDREAGTVQVRRSWKETSGEGHRLGPPKSARSHRTVSLPPEALELVEPLLAARSATSFLFVNTRGGPVRHATFYDNVWAPAVRLANGEAATGSKRIARRKDALGAEILPAQPGTELGKRPRIHDLRHTYASWMIAAGIPLPVIQALMGHESITTTVGTYGHLDRSASSVATAAMSRALGQALPTVLPPAGPLLALP